MFSDMLALSNNGGKKEIDTITGSAQQTNTFNNAIVGHRYIIAAASFSGSNLSYTGIDVIDETSILKTQVYSGNWTELAMVIGVATSTTIKVTTRTSEADTVYSNIIWIDLDAQ